ncbi:MAG: FKBP-type peptidyl-prolyl cis-trans isomerase [Candidatus Lokiarchaeota archaeon]|nr:FKBP-type peptidyl-prolyl cis-trans isomerase [Candidatus Lokiarchaeota archaeon]
MSLKLEDVKGLGKKSNVLKEAGIDSVEKLANSKIEDLIELNGIGQAIAEKIIENAKSMLNEKSLDKKEEPIEADNKEEQKPELTKEEKEKIEKELKEQEERKKKLEGKALEEGDFILLKITGKTQKGKVFRVSSEEDAKKAGIYDEHGAQHGHYTPEFIVVGKPGFINEGLMQIVEKMNYFERKSVRIPPAKAFGKRDPAKIERFGIAKFRKMNQGKLPELGQDFTKNTKQGAQKGTVTNVIQGKVIVDYNHPLAGQNIDYNVEILDKIEGFEKQIEYFMVNKGIPKESVSQFKLNYNNKDKTLEIRIPQMFLFQNLTYVKFGLAMDLQTHMADEIGNVKFVEIYEKMPIPKATDDSVMEKVNDFNENKEKEEN